MLLVAASAVSVCMAGSPRVGVELGFTRLGPDQTAEIRVSALRVLYWGYAEPSCEPRRAAILRALRAAAEDPDTVVIGTACWGLAWTGEPGFEILLDLRRSGKTEDVRWYAASRIGLSAEWHPDIARTVKEKAIPALAADLKSDKNFVRNAALASLYWLGPESLPHVVTVIGDKDSGRRAREVMVRYPKAAGPVLAKALDTTDADTIINICWTIRDIKAEGKPAVAALTRHLAHRNDPVKCWAADALGAIGPASRPAVPGLLKMYEVSDADFNRHATYALPRIGMEADQVAPALTGLPNGIGEAAERAVADAIATAGEKAVPALTTAIESGRHVQKVVGLAAAAKIGKPMAPAADSIRELVPNDLYRDAAVDALLAIGVSAKVAVSFLMKDMEDDWREDILAGGRLGFSSAAGMRLGRIGAEALPALREGLRSGNEKVRKGSLYALMAMGPPAKETIPLILDLPKMSRHEAEIAAAALAAIDPEKYVPKKGAARTGGRRPER